MSIEFVMLFEPMPPEVSAIAALENVHHMLEVVCRSTGMGFSAVARVTDAKWLCCAVRDEIAFGVKPGDELVLETTICNEIRMVTKPVVIDHVAEDPAFKSHHTPAMYGFQSYISVPIVLSGGEFWGTLCAIDPKPNRVDTVAIRGMFKLFSQLLAAHLDGLAHNRSREEAFAESQSALLTSQSELGDSRAALATASNTALLREQFIALLGHDMRTPLHAISMGLSVIEKSPERGGTVIPLMKRSVSRMSDLVDDVFDLSRGQLGSGMEVFRTSCLDLGDRLQQIIDEARLVNKAHEIGFESHIDVTVYCDPLRISQLVQNLVANACAHGQDDWVRVSAKTGIKDLTITVTNAGSISAESQARFFEPYFHAAKRRTGEGLGLGLFIASMISIAHEGTLEVKSMNGETTFTFMMPLA